MGFAGGLDLLRVARQKRLNVGQVFGQGDRITRLLVCLVPLIMIVENQGDDIEEILDEAVGVLSLIHI